MKNEILQNLITGEYSILKDKIEAEKSASHPYCKISADDGNCISAYEVDEHRVYDNTKRLDKQATNAEGGTYLVPVARIGIPLQKRIVKLAAAFLCGNPIEIESAPANDGEKTMLDLIKKVWSDCKLDFKSKEIAKRQMAETECAELWYAVKSEPEYWADTTISGSEFKLRMRIISEALGDKLFPVFDPSGDLIAFGRGYISSEDELFDLYTDTMIYKGIKSKDTGAWSVSTEVNIIGKIPVIYYKQEAPEWHDVQDMIDRLETLISNHADTNDYFGSPMVVVEGTVKGFAKKGESGKLLEIESGSNVSYLTWNQAPESVKLEIDNLLKLIYTSTQTPDISFEQVKGLGPISGIALKMLFMDAHLKASDKAESFGECIQRRINLIKVFLSKINVPLSKYITLTASPKFKYFMPNNDAETIDILTTAVTGGIISKETATGLNPFVVDPANEVKKIDAEAKSAQALSNLFNQ